MSAFGGLLLTNKGRNLQAKAQVGTPLVYTRIGIGDGQLGTSPIFELNSLKNEVMSLPIGKIKVINSTNAVIGTILNNNSITSGFYFREIGVFATDPDIGEILYCYGNAGNAAEYIPPGGGADLIEKAIDVQVLTGNATNISAVIDQSLIFETPTGAQEKADAAKEAAKKHSDENLATHLADKVKHITSEERIDWNQKETIDGAQKKANNAESNVKQWVNLQKGAVNGLAELDENGRVKNKDGSIPSDWILINDINLAGRNAIELHIEQLAAYRRLEIVMIGLKAGTPGSSGSLSLYINSITHDYTYQQTGLASGNVTNYAFNIGLGNIGQDSNVDFPRIATIYNDHKSTRAIAFDSVTGASRHFGAFTGAAVPLYKLILKSFANFTEGRVIVRGILA